MQAVSVVTSNGRPDCGKSNGSEKMNKQKVQRTTGLTRAVSTTDELGVTRGPWTASVKGTLCVLIIDGSWESRRTGNIGISRIAARIVGKDAIVVGGPT